MGSCALRFFWVWRRIVWFKNATILPRRHSAAELLSRTPFPNFYGREWPSEAQKDGVGRRRSPNVPWNLQKCDNSASHLRHSAVELLPEVLFPNFYGIEWPRPWALVPRVAFWPWSRVFARETVRVNANGLWSRGLPSKVMSINGTSMKIGPGAAC